jgi:hypothetical protein
MEKMQAMRTPRSRLTVAQAFSMARKWRGLPWKFETTMLQERPGMGQRVGGGVDEGQLQKGVGAVAFRQEAEHAHRQPLAFQRVGAEGQVRPVHLERRAGDHHHAAALVELIEPLLRQGLPAQQGGLGAFFHGRPRFTLPPAAQAASRAPARPPAEYRTRRVSPPS